MKHCALSARILQSSDVKGGSPSDVGLPRTTSCTQAQADPRAGGPRDRKPEYSGLWPKTTRSEEEHHVGIDHGEWGPGFVDGGEWRELVLGFCGAC